MSAIRIWLKNPLAVFTANDLDARGGLVIEGGFIAELIAAGQQPALPCPAIRYSTRASMCCCRA